MPRLFMTRVLGFTSLCAVPTFMLAFKWAPLKLKQSQVSTRIVVALHLNYLGKHSGGRAPSCC